MHTDTPIAAHTHAAGLGACLDLINTLELTDGRPDEHLRTVDDALAFLVERDLGHEADLRRQSVKQGAAWLDRVHAARSALRELWDAAVDGRAPAASSVATLNALLDRAPRIELRRTLAGVEVAHRHLEDDPTGEALARTATPLVEAIGAGDTGRFRICANDGCRWVFEDASRAGRRRWCDMTTCGNRAKAQRFRSRHRTTKAPAGRAEAAKPPSPPRRQETA
jgi:predicted RNA-binding Zn ribbon-like protein